MWKLLHTAARKKRRPRILLLVDRRGWAYDISAREIVRHLKDDFDFDLKYVQVKPKLDPSRYDLIYVFFWGEPYYRKFKFEPERVIKEVSSHRWEDDPRYGPCTEEEFAARYLNDCQAVICTSLRLTRMLEGVHPNVHHTPNGISITSFPMKSARSGPMTIGWAGNIADPLKGYYDILEPACRGQFRLLTASGKVPHSKMNRFYNQVDIFAVASRHEGEPLTLIEAMASGCFPVCTDVGIVPELVRHQVNGYIVAEGTPRAFAEAFRWCEKHLKEVRAAGEKNSLLIREARNWDKCALTFRKVFMDTYEEVSRPRFRNDDVSWDTSLLNFKRFCDIFHRRGLRQLHGVTLRGCTNTLYLSGDTPVEYDGYDTIARLDNSLIRALSEGKNLEERLDLVSYLNSIPDEIALHGLYHTDYAKMPGDEQADDLRRGLEIMERLFPGKKITYFIPPFNRTNKMTYKVCSDLGLRVLGTEGIHLESELRHLTLERNTWYRYHHHRFYPDSRFSYYNLSLELLEEAIRKEIME